MTTNKRRTAIIAEYRRGDRVRDIAARHNVSDTVVCKYANAAGLSRQSARTERPKLPCLECGNVTRAKRGVCQSCLQSSAWTNPRLTESDTLSGGRWVRRGLTHVWMPDAEVMSADEWRALKANQAEARAALRTLKPPTELTADEKDHIVRVAADRLGVTVDELRGRIRTPKIAHARHIISWLLRSEGVMFSQIGVLLDRDHSSIIYGVGRVEQVPELMEQSLSIRAELAAKDAA